MSAALCWAAALAAPAVSLPADQDPAAWEEALAFAGLGVASDGELVLEQIDGTWRLCIAARCVETPAPTSEGDRETIALLGRSLARELEMPRGPAPRPASPRLRTAAVEVPSDQDPVQAEVAPEPLLRTSWPAPAGPALAPPPPWRVRLQADLRAATWQGEATTGSATVAAWWRTGPVFLRADVHGATAASLDGSETRDALRVGGGIGVGASGDRLDTSLGAALDRETWRQDSDTVARLAVPLVHAEAGWRWPLADSLALRASVGLDASLRDVALATAEGTFAQRGRVGGAAGLGVLVGR